MNFYKMSANSSVSEYAWPGDQLRSLCGVCASSEFQFLNHDAIEVELDPDGGTEYPDFILYLKRVPLVSQKFRQMLENLRVDNLFYKPVHLVCRELGLNELYWLALAPRIDCLDWEKCIVKEIGQPHLPFWAKIWNVTQIAIDPEKTGNYLIFKLPVCTINQEIVVTESLKTALEPQNYVNLHFHPLNPEQI